MYDTVPGHQLLNPQAVSNLQQATPLLQAIRTSQNLRAAGGAKDLPWKSGLARPRNVDIWLLSKIGGGEEAHCLIPRYYGTGKRPPSP